MIEQYIADPKIQKTTQSMNPIEILQSEVVIKTEALSPPPSPKIPEKLTSYDDTYEKRGFIRHQENSMQENSLGGYQLKRPSVLRNMGTPHANLVKIQAFSFIS